MEVSLSLCVTKYESLEKESWFVCFCLLFNATQQYYGWMMMVCKWSSLDQAIKWWVYEQQCPQLVYDDTQSTHSQASSPNLFSCFGPILNLKTPYFEIALCNMFRNSCVYGHNFLLQYTPAGSVVTSHTIQEAFHERPQPHSVHNVGVTSELILNGFLIRCVNRLWICRKLQSIIVLNQNTKAREEIYSYWYLCIEITSTNIGKLAMTLGICDKLSDSLSCH